MLSPCLPVRAVASLAAFRRAGDTYLRERLTRLDRGSVNPRQKM